MIVMQKLSKEFEREHPDIHLDWVVLEENILRHNGETKVQPDQNVELALPPHYIHVFDTNGITIPRNNKEQG